MTKKLTALLCAALLVLTMASCAPKAESGPSGPTAPAQTEPSDGGSQKNDDTHGSAKKETSAGTENYTLTGNISEKLTIETDKDVVITLDNATATLTDSVINVKSANSVKLILIGDSVLTSTAEEEKTVKCKADLTIEGTGSLTVRSAETCIKSSTNLTVESGTLILKAGTGGDGLRSDETLTVNGGTVDITASEGIESTQITINGGDVIINAQDDGLNASGKSETLQPKITIAGGSLNITMAQGDTDAIDSNGELIISGGRIDITAQFAFDFAGNAIYTGGEVYVNGQKVTQIANSMFGGFGEVPGGGPWGGGGPGGPAGGGGSGWTGGKPGGNGNAGGQSGDPGWNWPTEGPGGTDGQGGGSGWNQPGEGSGQNT